MGLGYVEAFAVYGAKLTNPQWSVSAFGSDGALVLSLWENLLARGAEKGTMVYRDKLSEWLGNPLGRAELHEHLRVAQAKNLPIRLVIAHPATLKDREMVGRVADESLIKKTFSARVDVEGSLESLDGDALFIVFRKAT